MTQDLLKLNTQEMEQAGLQIGHKVSKLHPHMKPYLSGVKNTVHMINLDMTAEKLGEALKFIYNLLAEGKTLLVVGTKVPSKEIVRLNATEAGLPYVNVRWLGGTFTNFDTILKRVNHFKELERQKQIGGLEKYTKKERLDIDKEIVSLKTKFEGVKDLQKLPEAVLILDMNKDGLAAGEAKSRGIKTVAVCDTNIDPNLIDYPIPANDDNVSSIKYILEKVKDVAIQAKQEFESKNKK